MAQANAGSMIAEVTVVMEFGGAAEVIAWICHAHRALPEAVKEAAMVCRYRARFVCEV